MVINGFGHRKVEFTLQVYDPNVVQIKDPSESLLLSEHGIKHFLLILFQFIYL